MSIRSVKLQRIFIKEKNIVTQLKIELPATLWVGETELDLKAEIFFRKVGGSISIDNLILNIDEAMIDELNVVKLEAELEYLFDGGEE